MRVWFGEIVLTGPVLHSLLYVTLPELSKSDFVVACWQESMACMILLASKMHAQLLRCITTCL